MNGFVLVGVGAMLGAWSRWLLGEWLNKSLPNLALGTLLANWLGCALMGVAMAKCGSGSLKLLFMVGFLGSFTTFSSFSAEVVQHLQQEKWFAAMNVFVWHTLGGLLACGGAFVVVKKFL